MESFAAALESLVNLGPDGIGRFGASLSAEWIDEALEATGTASIRRRKLPAEQAVWLVLGMALFADRSIRDVVDHLGLMLPGVTSLAPSVVSTARGRLGPEPMEWLFNKVASTWANIGGKRGFRGLSLFAVDGTCLRVQDSDANFLHFGKPGGRAGPGDAGYPQLRLACLLNLDTRLLVGAKFGPFATSEQELARALWPVIPSRSLTILDRGFIDYTNFATLIDVERERHLLIRIREDMRPEEIEELDDGTLKVRLVPTKSALAATPELPAEIVGRMIVYEYPNGSTGRLFTTLTDAAAFPAQEMVDLYHERWEIELAFDELKTHMLERKECLRCKTPDRVAQELWGLLLTYNLVRREMLLVAVTNDLPSYQISFVSSLIWIRNFWLIAWRTSATNLPKHLGEFHSQLKVLFLPERRSERRYPRHVKIKMSKYPRNRGSRGQAGTASLK